jgi:hypothetical protein
MSPVVRCLEEIKDAIFASVGKILIERRYRTTDLAPRLCNEQHSTGLVNSGRGVSCSMSRQSFSPDLHLRYRPFQLYSDKFDGGQGNEC